MEENDNKPFRKSVVPTPIPDVQQQYRKNKN